MNRGIIFIFIFLVFISGCGLTYKINVNSINDPNAKALKKYMLMAGSGIESTSLLFKEYASYVHKALYSRGFVEAERFEDVELIIFMRYGIKYLGKNKDIVSLPLLGEKISPAPPGLMSMPRIGITGYVPVTITKETYFSYLLISAYNCALGHPERVTQQWKTMVSSYTSKGDLREDMPVLVTAVKPYIGSNTGKSIEIRLNENNKAVMEIKGLTNKK